jgi:UrcA family protein
MKLANVPATVALCALATALAAVGPATAAPSSDSSIQVVSESVRSSDLDLNTSAGADRLALRIQLAANRVCGQIYMRGSDDLAPCHKAAIARAVSGLDAPLVKSALGLSPRSDTDLAAR